MPWIKALTSWRNDSEEGRVRRGERHEVSVLRAQALVEAGNAEITDAPDIAETPSKEPPVPEDWGPDEVTSTAAALATQEGIDLRQVEGSGKGGRILKSDVQELV